MSTDEQHADTPGTETAAEATKRKFREALDRKKNGQQARAGHLDGESAIHGTQAKADHKREFRRKSG